VASKTLAVNKLRELFGVARAVCFVHMAGVVAQCGTSQPDLNFLLSSGNMPVFPDSSHQIVPFVREIRHFSGQTGQNENFIRGKSDFHG
jgi:hypothetical protein